MRDAAQPHGASRGLARPADRPDRRLAQSLSWTLFLLVSLGVLVAALSHMASAGPAGELRSDAHALSGSLAITLGPPPTIHAATAYLFDPDTGSVFYEKSADTERAMASCTKVMTLLLAVEHGNLDQLVTIGPDAAALVGPDSSYMGVSVGERISLNDLLYGLALPSGNDAAVAIADAVGGTEARFVDLMNQKAQQLGLAHTHFMNPHGLDAPGHYTTARDLAVLSAVAMKNPQIVKITSTLHYSIPKTDTHKAFELETGNDLLSGARSPYPGAIGVKPGFTGNAGFTMSFAAVRHGHLIVGAVMDEASWQIRIVDMRALLDYGFEQEGLAAAPPPVPWQQIAANS